MALTWGEANALSWSDVETANEQLPVRELIAKAATYVSTREDNTYLIECVTSAQSLVAQHIGTAVIPESVLERAVVEVAAELYWRQQARNGVTQFDGGAEAGPELVRIGNDPLRAIRPLLRPYLAGGFA